MSFKVLDGSFGQGSGRLSAGFFELPFAKIKASSMVSADIATQENLKRLTGTLGWGAVGGLVLGPIGFLAGLLLGGKKTELTFIVTFEDGRAFLATSDPKTWAEIKGAAVRYANYRALSEGKPSVVEIAPTRNGPLEPAASAPASERLEWSFAMNDWDFVHLPRQGFQRYEVYDARKGMRTAYVVVSPDPLTDDYLHEYCQRLDALEPRTDRLVIAPAIRPSAVKFAEKRQIKILTPAQLPDGIEQR